MNFRPIWFGFGRAWRTAAIGADIGRGTVLQLAICPGQTSRIGDITNMTIPQSTLIYDCEIINAIPPRPGVERLHGVNYCAGWGDVANMGIACICAYDYETDLYRVFGEGNLDNFQTLVWNRENVVGFNSLAFDDELCNAEGLEVKTTYDLLVEVWRATGQPLKYTRGVTQPGTSLDELAYRNLGLRKSNSGDLAPVLWQRGHHAAVIDYCLRDVALTRGLLELGEMRDPITDRCFQLNAI